MENIRNHKDIKLVTSKEKDIRYVMKRNFKDGYPFSRVICYTNGKNRDKVEAILDLGKTLKAHSHV